MAAEAEAAREARAKVSYLLPSFERTTSDDPWVASMTEWQKVKQKQRYEREREREREKEAL